MKIKTVSKLNPIKAGVSESMYNLGERFAPHPLEKENRYRVEIHVNSPIFPGQLIEKKLDRQL